MRTSLRLKSLLPKPNTIKQFSTTTLRKQPLKMSTGIPNQTPDQRANLAAGQKASYSASTTSAGELGIESDDYITAAGVELSGHQKVLVGSVLDLFAGKPTLKKLALWTDDATFNDPLTKAEGRKQYSAQWYGLAAAFSEITRQAPPKITSSGNPITMDVSTKYKVKGLGTEKIIDSVIKIFTDAAGEKIVKVEDRWNGNIPEGPIATAFRNLNSVAVPVFVGVPKNEEEDLKKQQK